MITKFDAHWTGNGYALPKRWARKADMPRLNPGVRSVRLAFRWEVAWVAMESDGSVLMQDGEWLPTWDFRLNEFGRVIGPRDFAASNVEKWGEAWRGAAMDLRRDQLTAQAVASDQ